MQEAEAVAAAADDEYESVVEISSLCTPANVLDAQCFSSSSSENNQTISEITSESGNGDFRGLKRRKTSDFAAEVETSCYMGSVFREFGRHALSESAAIADQNE
ncbi:hypothetical protein Salat_2001100 [Sesamum alatum]|uniref:Uncharacterized protein n=1 Tax=Sesamum alatum TaxID=300844 RepID=A0AAE1XZJ7_9LAMI|nr:hypothetical protein Salat_2001100 [Sesamum alatum]